MNVNATHAITLIFGKERNGNVETLTEGQPTQGYFQPATPPAGSSTPAEHAAFLSGTVWQDGIIGARNTSIASIDGGGNYNILFFDEFPVSLWFKVQGVAIPIYVDPDGNYWYGAYQYSNELTVSTFSFTPTPFASFIIADDGTDFTLTLNY